jgi:hypothetical protein
MLQREARWNALAVVEPLKRSSLGER